MDWHYFNTKKKIAEEEGQNLFSTLTLKYEKKKRGATSPESEIREQMSKLLNKSIPYICGKTKGWTLDEMTQIYLKASKWKVNPPALLNKLIREKNIEIKLQLGNN